jgi:hypothetical protein
MRPIIQTVGEDPKNLRIRANENGLKVLKALVAEAEASLSYERTMKRENTFPKKFAARLDDFSAILVVIAPEVDPSDPTQQDKLKV